MRRLFNNLYFNEIASILGLLLSLVLPGKSSHGTGGLILGLQKTYLVKSIKENYFYFITSFFRACLFSIRQRLKFTETLKAQIVWSTVVSSWKWRILASILLGITAIVLRIATHIGKVRQEFFSQIKSVWEKIRAKTFHKTIYWKIRAPPQSQLYWKIIK